MGELVTNHRDSEPSDVSVVSWFMDQPRVRLLWLVLMASWGCQGSSGIVRPPTAASLPAAPAVDFDPAAKDGRVPPLIGPPPPLAVLEFGPRGDTDAHADVHVRFNQAVVSLGDGSLEEGGIAIDIEPKQPGRCFWRTPDQLVFEPEELAPAQRYKATVRLAAVATGTAAALFSTAPLSWTFETAGPQVTDWLPGEDETWGSRDPLYLKMSQPVDLARLAARLHVRTAAGRLAARVVPVPPSDVRRAHAFNPWSIRRYDGDDDDEGGSEATEARRRRLRALGELVDEDDLSRRLFQVEPPGRWPASAEVTVEVASGLVGRLGPVPSASDWRQSFKTPAPLSVKAIERPEGWDLDAYSGVRVELSADVAKSELRHIRVVPRPEDLVIGSGVQRSSSSIDIDGRFKPGRRYVLELDASMRATTGYTVGDGTGGKTLRKSIPIYFGRTMHLSTGGTFAATTPPLVGLETRRVQSVVVKAALLDAEREAEWLATQKDSHDAHEIFARFAAKAPLSTKTYTLSPTGPSEWSDIAVDLRDLIGSRRGQVLIEAEAVAGAGGPTPQPAHADFHITDLAPITIDSSTRSLVKLVRLSDGQPVAGAQVLRLDSDGTKQTPVGHTDEHGQFVVERGRDDAEETERTRLILLDPDHRDHVIVSAGGVGDNRSRGKKVPGKALRPGERLLTDWVTERDAYRPGDTVHVVGWAMVDTPFTRTGLRALPAGEAVELSLKDWHGKVVAKRSVPLDADGKCWATLPIPKEAGLGHVELIAQLLGVTDTKYLKVEDYRTPEYAVTARPVLPWTVAGEAAEVRIGATQYSGVPVTLGEVSYSTTCHPTAPPLPALEKGWVVGTGNHFHLHSGKERRGTVREVAGQRGGASFSPEVSLQEHVPNRCTVEVQVQDAAKQAVGAQTQLVVHPASYYLAVHAPPSTFAGDRGEVAVRALDPDGRRRAAGTVKVEVRRSWLEDVRTKEGVLRREHREGNVASCRLPLSAEKDGACSWGLLAEGTHTVTLSGQDEKGRAVRTETSFWVTKRPDRSSKRPLEVVKERPVVQVEWLDGQAPVDAEPRYGGVSAGDRIRVHVASACDASDAVLLLERAGIREQHALKLVDHAASLDFVTDDSWSPQVDLEALIVCQPRKDGHATIERASQTVKQPAKQRALTVTLAVAAQTKPGATIPLAVTVRDGKAEHPVAAHVALWAVDEAVLSLTNYRVSDPLPRFIPERGPETHTWHGFDQLLKPYQPTKEDPSLRRGYGMGYGTLGCLSGHGAGGGGIGLAETAPPARARFETTPLFLGDLLVGADGTAKTSIHLPDNLTTFRVTAIASARLEDGKSPGRFGIGEGQVQVTAPFIVRAALPRVLRPNDTAEIAAIVENQSGQGGRLLVEARVAADGSALSFSGAGRKEVTLGEGAEMRIPFLVRAVQPGNPEVELRAQLSPGTGAAFTDAIRVPIQVEVEPSSRGRAATYGSLTSDEATAVRMRLPAGVWPEEGGISVSVSSSLLGDLRDAVDYLVGYPYGCIEQTSSRVLSLVAARQLGQRYSLPAEQAAKYFSDGVARMASMQLESGGFAYWPEASMVHPYATAYATWTLLMARRAGFPVPEPVVGRAVEFLAKSLHGDGQPAARHATADVERATALHVLAEAGQPLPDEALSLAYAQRSQLPQFARALLLMALHKMAPADPRVAPMVDELTGSISELPATAHVREGHPWGLDQVFHSDARSDAMVLLALLQVQPKHAVVAKLVRGLLERRMSGRWRNTQENVYAILAVLEYARRFEAADTRFVAEAWVNEKPILKSSFAEEVPSSSPTLGFLPMAEVLAPGKAPTIVLRKQGEGRMYFRVGAEWTAGDLLPAAANQGIDVGRLVRAGAGPAVEQESPAVAAGEPIAFDITLANRAELAYVAVDVPVPAGLEPVLETLGKGHRASTLAGANGSWIDHQEKRPDRVLLFADSLQPGIHRHTIQLRATTPGRFALPPARAEAMYAPEVYGRSAGTDIVVR